MSRKNPSSSPAGGQSRQGSTLAVPRRYGAIVLACTLVAFGVGYLVSVLQPKKYSSTSEVLVRDPEMAEASQNANRLTATQIEVIQSGPVSALAREKLAAKGFGEPLSGVLEVSRAPASDVVYVTAKHRSPIRARDVSQAVAEAYVERNRRDNLAHLSTQAAEIRRRIDALRWEAQRLEGDIAFAQQRATATPSEPAFRDAVEGLKKARDQMLAQTSALQAKLDQVEVDARTGAQAARVLTPAGVASAPV